MPRAYALFFQLLLAIVATLVARQAFAQDKAAAQDLFDQGHAAIAAGKVNEACGYFKESLELEPSPGTLANLAHCHERQGRTATAWAEFVQASHEFAQAGRHEEERQAAGRAAALKPQLSYLTVEVRKPSPGLSVTRQLGPDRAIPVGPAQFGTRVAIDPGEWTIAVSATGYQSWSATVTIAANASDARVEVPPLTRNSTPARPAEEAPAPPPQVREPTITGPSTTAYVLAGGGLLFIGAGTVFGVLAKLQYDDAHEECPEHTGCSDAAMSAGSRATTYANVSTAGFALGLVGVGIGTALILTTDSEASSGQTLRLVGTHGGAGLHYRRTF